jgi:RND superfamily putative drug exporter
MIADGKAVQEVAGVRGVIAPLAPAQPPDLFSQDKTTGFVAIPINEPNSDKRTETIEEIREITGTGENGLEIRLTGGAALQSDLTTTLQSTDAALLVATALLVLILLIIIYRSPLIALLPLVVVGIGYTIAEGVVHLGANALDVTVDRTAITLLAILMFGAGTDYCLLLVARYSSELRANADKHTAIGNAVRRAGPAIAASGMVVAGALVTLLVADLQLNKVFGPVNAVGVVIGMIASLTLLPALLAVVGRRGFWPSSGHIALQTPTERVRLASGLNALPSALLEHSKMTIDSHPAVRQRDGLWRKVGLASLKRPVFTLVSAGLVLVICALGILNYEEDVNVVGQFRADAESTDGYELLRKSFPPGLLYPNTVLVRTTNGQPVDPSGYPELQEAIRGIDGVANVRVNATSENKQAATFIVTFADDPFQPPALKRAEELRELVAERAPPDTEVLVGDGSALRVDYRDAAKSDTKKVVPLALFVITAMLCVLLRALVAPLYLLVATVLSFLATLGISLLVFEYVFDEPTVDPALPLLTFVFLVALGVDYNIFLMDRVREEAREHGTREGVLNALVATGPVITSAGIVLAGTFAVLMTLPLDILLELGFAVALGVLLDTFLVRTLIVPALVTLFGDFSWWPSKLRPPDEATGQPLPQQPPPPPIFAPPPAGPAFPPPSGAPPSG